MVYPRAHLLGCSTAGEICGTQVTDDSLIATAVHFEHTRLFGARIKIGEIDSSFSAGEYLAKSLDKKGLAHVLVLSDGLKVNGSDLVKGVTKHLPTEITVTGGLSGDGERPVALQSTPQTPRLQYYTERVRLFSCWRCISR